MGSSTSTSVVPIASDVPSLADQAEDRAEEVLTRSRTIQLMESPQAQVYLPTETSALKEGECYLITAWSTKSSFRQLQTTSRLQLAFQFDKKDHTKIQSLSSCVVHAPVHDVAAFLYDLTSKYQLSYKATLGGFD